MKMAKEDIRKYPKFYQYVSVAIPTVRKMTNIVSALKRFSGSSDTGKITEALEWNKGPMIKIVDNLMCGSVEAVGCYTDGVNVLEIDEGIVKEFEAGKGKRKSRAGYVYLVGVTLLHELCHWANDGTGKSDLTHDRFEQALYGGVIN